MIKLPKSRRVKGLYIYCNSCNKLFSDDKKLKEFCKCFKKNDSLVYRVRFKISEKKFISKTLETKELDVAIKECNHLYNLKNKPESFNPVKLDSSLTISQSMDIYTNFLNNIDVPSFQVRNRTKGHINEVKRHFKYSQEALLLNNVDPKFVNIKLMSIQHVGFIYTYITEVKKFRNRTFNKFISTLRAFIEYIRRNFAPELKNPFLDVVLKSVKTNIDIITKDEFSELLKIIRQDNGIIKLRTGERKNLYKSWLIVLFKLGLYTGRRREELLQLRFTDIMMDLNGIPIFIKSDHLKLNRMRNAYDEESKDYVLIPITREVFTLLIELNYNELKGTDSYLIAPFEKMNRNSMMILGSRGFSHYYSLLNRSRRLQFKCLRKTYITRLFMKYGDSTMSITQHSSMEVIKKHYLDQKPLLDSIRDFSVFGE